jgi:hypothetical protein
MLEYNSRNIIFQGFLIFYEVDHKMENIRVNVPSELLLKAFFDLL